MYSLSVHLQPDCINLHWYCFYMITNIYKFERSLNFIQAGIVKFFNMFMQLTFSISFWSFLISNSCAWFCLTVLSIFELSDAISLLFASSVSFWALTAAFAASTASRDSARSPESRSISTSNPAMASVVTRICSTDSSIDFLSSEISSFREASSASFSFHFFLAASSAILHFLTSASED